MPEKLTDVERAVYEWQIWVDDFRERGQELLKGASVLVSRVGGLGSVVAYELAAAGIGKLVLAHAGNIKPIRNQGWHIDSFASRRMGVIELPEPGVYEVALNVEAVPDDPVKFQWLWLQREDVPAVASSPE